MKFGKQLKQKAYKEWAPYYVNYNRFKRMLKRFNFQAGRRLKHRTEREVELERNRVELAKRAMGKDGEGDGGVGNGSDGNANSEAEHNLTALEDDERSETTSLWGTATRQRRGYDSTNSLQRQGRAHDSTGSLPRGGFASTGSLPSLAEEFETKQEEILKLHRQRSLDEKSANQVEFFAALDQELHKVDAFYLGKMAELSNEVDKFEERERMKNSWSAPSGNTSLHAIRLYSSIIMLRGFMALNREGFRKIVKKYDKAFDTQEQDRYMETVERMSFAKFHDWEALSSRAQRLLSRDKLLEAERYVNELSSHGAAGDESVCVSVKFVPLILSAILFVLALKTAPLHTGMPHADRCFAVLVLATSMWVTEAVPYYVTALLVPVLVVFCDVLETPGAKGHTMPRDEAAEVVLGSLVNHTTVLIMGGYSISAAFSRCEIELRVASFLQKRLGHSPRLFILSMMYLGLFLSMLISNHTAPVLCVSILLPIVRDCADGSRFAKALLLGLAFACNFGGMITPISSMQNVVATQALENAGYPISFGVWMGMGLPFCLTGVFVTWVLLMAVMNPTDMGHIPLIVYTKDRIFTPKNVTVLLMTAATIGLWSSISLTEPIFGDLGIIALCFMVIIFGSGMLREVDFNSFSWHTLFLLGGGNVLGKAISSSHLLNWIATRLLLVLPQDSEWLLVLTVVSFTMAVSTFISHTVAAIILMPIIIKVGVQRDIPVTLGVAAALAVSAGCALPFSSFPNVTSLYVTDDNAKPYLKVYDFARSGFPLSVLTVLLIVTLGYVLVEQIVLPSMPDDVR